MNMPRFYFHIHDQDGTIPDTEGMVFPDVASAKREGQNSARELLAANGRAGHFSDGGRVEVVAEDGSVIAVYPF